jgi:hypothetical protein
VLPGRTPEAKLRAFVLGLLQHMYGEDRPAWPVRLMTHELAQPTPAFDGVVDQIMRPRHDAIRALVAGVIGRPVDDRQTRLCAQSIMGQIITYAHGREVLKRLWPDLQFTPETLEEIAGHIASFSYAALKSFARRNAAAKPKQKQTARSNMKNFHFIDAQAGRARTVIILIVLLLAAGAVTVLARGVGQAGRLRQHHRPERAD